jgi:glycosyltransferase involved in cell wall biosynthesis
MASRALGGAETYAVDMMLSLRAAGLDQHAVMARGAPRIAELRAAGVAVTEITTIRPLQRLPVRRVLNRVAPDLVHCWMRRAAALMPVWGKGPVLGWFGGYYDPSDFARCTDLVGVTADIARHMRDHGVDPEHAFHVPTFPDVREEPAIDRASVQTPADVPVVLALSRLHEKKGLDTLLQAAALVPGLYVWLAGEGPLRGRLEALVDQLRLRDRVRFLGWRTDRGALLRAATICALPSRYEPFGTVILEAWAAGTAFVACRSAGPAGQVRDGEDGVLVPVDDARALAAAMTRMVQDPAFRQHLIRNGYAAYRRGFTREAVTRRMIAVYEHLLA